MPLGYLSWLAVRSTIDLVLLEQNVKPGTVTFLRLRTWNTSTIQTNNILSAETILSMCYNLYKQEIEMTATADHNTLIVQQLYLHYYIGKYNCIRYKGYFRTKPFKMKLFFGYICFYKRLNVGSFYYQCVVIAET